MPILKMRHYLLLTCAILLPLAAIAVSSGTAFAQSYCSVEVGSVAASTQYSGGNYYGQYNAWNIQLTVPISMTCPNVGSPLWVVGNAYDTVANTNLGSASTIMNSYNGYYSGQLVFTLPPSVVEHTLQLQISVYGSYNNGQYGSLVATTSPTVTIHSTGNYYAPYNSYPSYYNGYPSYCYYDGGYMYCYYSSYYYYYPSPYYYTSSCFNGQALIYYNGAYYYVNCSRYWRHH